MNNIKRFFILIFIFASFIANSQNVYPKKLTINGDTVVAITIPQLRKLNLMFVNTDYLKEMNDTLNSQNKNYGIAVSKFTSLTASYENQLKIRKGQIDEQNAIIENYKKMDKKWNRKVKLLRWERNILAISTAMLGGYIYLQTHK